MWTNQLTTTLKFKFVLQSKWSVACPALSEHHISVDIVATGGWPAGVADTR